MSGKAVNRDAEEIPRTGENTAGRDRVWRSRIKTVLLKRKPKNVHRQKEQKGKEGPGGDGEGGSGVPRPRKMKHI